MQKILLNSNISADNWGSCFNFIRKTLKTDKNDTRSDFMYYVFTHVFNVICFVYITVITHTFQIKLKSFIFFYFVNKLILIR